MTMEGPAGGGEMEARVRAFDWSATALGPSSLWSPTLRAGVQACLDAGFAGFIFYGPELTQIYNDSALGIVRDRHPSALGAPADRVWSDIWGQVGPRVRSVLATGRPVVSENLPLRMARAGGIETAYFTLSYSALRDEAGAVGGVLVTAIDTTETVATAERLRRSEERLRLAVDVGQLGTWDWIIATGEASWSDEHFRIMGYAPGEVTPSYEAWLDRVHPDDRAGAAASLTAARDGNIPYVRAYRAVRPDGSVRWCQARGRFFYDEAGQPVRMIGVVRDATAERAAAERQRTLLLQLQRRSRDLLGLIRNTAARTAESSDGLVSFMAAFLGRLEALARTESALIRNGDAAVDLESLLLDEFLAAAASHQVGLSGPEATLTGKAAEAMSLAIHELVTNALKYGALASGEGRVEVSWAFEGCDGGRRLAFRWRESGVPVLDTAPQRMGFGRRLLEGVLPEELGAETRLRFAPGGLVATLEIPLPEA